MAASIRAGDVLAGRYRMVDLLGEAEGGWFWCAHDEVLHRRVAVHLLAADDRRAPVLMDAARRAAVLSDRRNLRVLDADVTDALAFVVNEWGQGLSLDLILSSDGPMPPRRAAWLISEVADVIAKAHAAGVSHDHLLPEHVMIDENGEVRIIGHAVDAALHGVPTHQRAEDVTHLASLLYAALTGKWPGPGDSVVPSAPTEHGEVLRPRQVRAGIPRDLDRICDEVLLGGHHSRSLGLASMLGHRAEHDLTTAAGVRDALLEFLESGPGTFDVDQRLGNGRRPTVPPYAAPLPSQVGTPGYGHGAYVHSSDRAGTPGDPRGADPERTRVQPAAGPQPGGAPGGSAEAAEADTSEDALAPGRRAGDGATPPSDEQAGESGEHTVVESNGSGGSGVSGSSGEGRATRGPVPVEEVPTEAGMPVFHDEDVEWLRARAHKPAPPPEFEQPEERPLFAPDPPEGAPARRPRTSPPAQRPVDDYWPWDTSSPSATTGSGVLPTVGEPVPGRSMLRLAWLVGAAALVLLAVVAAYQLGLGAGDDPPPADDPSTTPSASNEPTAPVEVTATDFDPQGDPPEENPEDVPLALDGDPATAWGTQTYNEQLGPAGLKTGVGLLLDLGGQQAVRQVQVTVNGGEHAAQVYVTDSAPSSVDDLEPVGAGASDGVITVTLDEAVQGSHVVVWLTRLPDVGDGFRGEVAEVEVFR